MDQIGIGGHSHFFHDAAAVGADRFFTNAEFIHDILRSLSLCDHTQNLKFAVREVLVRSFIQDTQMGNQFLGERCTDILTPGIHFSDGFNQFVRCPLFHQVT